MAQSTCKHSATQHSSITNVKKQVSALTSRISSFRGLLKTPLVLLWTLGVYLSTTAIAKAGYIPPPYSPPPDSPDATGTRGPCGGHGQTLLGNSQISITILAPQTHVGQTVSTHPTMAWFVNDMQPFPMELHLYEDYGGGERQRLKVDLQSSPGIMTWTLPEQEPGLTVGQRYRWQVVLVCSANYYSNARVAGAAFDVVAPQADLTQALALAADPAIRSEIYAKQGLWYDALRETWRLDNARASRGRLSLLADLVHLGMITEPGYPNYNPDPNQILQLRQIIEFEQMAQGSS